MAEQCWGGGGDTEEPHSLSVTAPTNTELFTPAARVFCRIRLFSQQRQSGGVTQTTPPDQTERVGSGMLSCNIEHLKVNVSLFWSFFFRKPLFWGLSGRASAHTFDTFDGRTGISYRNE